MTRTYRTPLRYPYYWWPRWKVSSDCKPGHKAPHWYKALRGRKRRRGETMDVQAEREPERHRRTNDWDWN